METPSIAPPLHVRLVEGLERVAAALKADDWAAGRAAGLNPTQLMVLQALAGRPNGLSVKDLARQLSVSQPTTTDSVSALERKALVEKRPDAADGRALRVVITAAGRTAMHSAHATPGSVVEAAAALDTHDQVEMLGLLMSLIRQLQERDAIPIQRMCLSCRHFRPFAHADAARPHHCAFVDAAFGQPDMRMDCREHEAAAAPERAAIWAQLQQERPAEISDA